MRLRMRVTTASSCRPPSIAVVDVRTRVTEPRTGEREKSGWDTFKTCSHSSGLKRWWRYRMRGEKEMCCTVTMRLEPSSAGTLANP